MKNGSKSPTPAAQWRAAGEPDPHGKRYDCERADLAMGKLTDDELANGVFMNYNAPLNVHGILAGTHSSPIAWVTAAKDRIRWLSRSLERVLATMPTKLPVPPAQAEPSDVIYAEGWNACCDEFFGGKPAPEALVIEVTKGEPVKEREALRKIMEAHRFNMAGMPSHEVHSLCYEALGDGK